MKRLFAFEFEIYHLFICSILQKFLISSEVITYAYVDSGEQNTNNLCAVM